ncbi:hypothetical protein MLD38_021389 [Melastoma candidum]|uniref:Uncharacterized protein n=1 Tax=Melastoma candidum TaxID=119954 RepID=A0ACB9QGW7_9MYRT|nr:hypothetical protein MLD38_021389 [Melastoma candidum]
MGCYWPWFICFLAGACNMAIGELVFVYSQYDIEYAQIEREAVAAGTSDGAEERAGKLPNPWQAALVSALAFAAGAAIPL